MLNYRLISFAVTLALGLVPSVSSSETLELQVQVSDPYRILTNNDHSLVVTAVEIDTGNTVFSDVKDIRSSLYLNLDSSVAALLPSSQICFKIVGAAEIEGSPLFLREPCQATSINRLFAITLGTTTDYGVSFRDRTGDILSVASMDVGDFPSLHGSFSEYYQNQLQSELTIEDVRLFSRFVNFVDDRAPFVQDERFFSLELLNNPLSELSSEGYFTSHIFRFIEREVGATEDISADWVKAIAELYSAFQGVRPARFVDPGPLRDHGQFYSELFGFVLALDELDAGGFEASRNYPPLRKYVERCLEFGPSNANERDLCYGPFFSNITEINIGEYRDSVRRTVASKISQSFDCRDLDNESAAELLSSFEFLVGDNVCGADFAQCSPPVRQCIGELNEQ